MKHKFKFLLLLVLAALGYFYFEIYGFGGSEPRNFNHAKEYTVKVYSGNQKTFYCGCDYSYTRGTSGQVDLEGCGYEIRAASGSTVPSDGTITRAKRIEYEHIFPASWFGGGLACWSEGGRSNCSANDGLFNFMESDIINLTPSVGQVNGDRSNYWFSEFDYKSRPQYGTCDFTVNFRERLVQPRDEIKGKIARVLLYMHDGYDVAMSSAQQRLLIEWNDQYPITEWEQERDDRIRKLIGRGNPYVSGDREWVYGQETSGFMLDYYNELQNDDGFSFDKKDFNNILSKIRRFL